MDLAKAYSEMGDRTNAILNFQKAYLIATDLERRQEAERILREMGANIPLSAPAKIYIRYQDPRDELIIKDLSDRLTRRGFEVKDTQLVSKSTPGDVRYFYVENKIDATFVERIVEYSFDLHKIKLDVQLIALVDTHPEIPRGNIEVWLPRLPDVKQALK